MKSFRVSSSHGYLIIDSQTELILECNSNKGKNDYLRFIVRFDVDRYKAAFKTSIIAEDVDILRFGYWSENNMYGKPTDGYKDPFD